MKRTLLCALLTGQALAQPPGLQFEEMPETDSRPKPTLSARTIPLTLAELSQLLSRLPALRAQAGDVQPFVLRQSVAPPKAGQRIEQVFPAPPQGPPPTVHMGPIEPVSYSPQGHHLQPAHAARQPPGQNHSAIPGRVVLGGHPSAHGHSIPGRSAGGQAPQLDLCHTAPALENQLSQPRQDQSQASPFLGIQSVNRFEKKP